MVLSIFVSCAFAPASAEAKRRHTGAVRKRLQKQLQKNRLFGDFSAFFRSRRPNRQKASRRLKSIHLSLQGRSKAAKRNFLGRPDGPEASREPFWSHFGTILEPFFEPFWLPFLTFASSFWNVCGDGFSTCLLPLFLFFLRSPTLHPCGIDTESALAENSTSKKTSARLKPVG